jgi:hypothetical protein
MDVREIGIDGANWIQLGQDRGRWRAFVSTVMKRLSFDKLSRYQLFKEYPTLWNRE